MPAQIRQDPARFVLAHFDENVDIAPLPGRAPSDGPKNPNIRSAELLCGSFNGRLVFSDTVDCGTHRLSGGVDLGAFCWSVLKYITEIAGTAILLWADEDTHLRCDLI